MNKVGGRSDNGQMGERKLCKRKILINDFFKDKKEMFKEVKKKEIKKQIDKKNRK